MTPDETKYEGSAVSLIAPSELGYLGVLADHAPLVANLSRGTITLREESGKTTIFSSTSGFLEVLKNTVTILLDK